MQYRSAASFATPYGEIGSGGVDSTVGSSGLVPYTDVDDEKTTRRTPSSRAASRTLSVPSTLTALEVSGSCTERGTEPSAPRWYTTSTPRIAACTRSYERSSPSTTSTSSPSRLARFPVEKLSSTRTLSPRSTSASARLEPINPAPPVTSAFTEPIFPDGSPKSSALQRWLQGRTRATSWR